MITSLNTVLFVAAWDIQAASALTKLESVHPNVVGLKPFMLLMVLRLLKTCGVGL